MEQRVLDGQAHIGRPHLRLDRAVGELHHGVYGALRMHHHLDALPRHAEQPVRLDDLKSLVHQSRGVYGYLLAHLPGGVPQRLLRCDAFHILQRSSAEWAARRSNQQAQDLVVLSLEALPDGAGFAVHRQHPAAVASLVVFNQLAGHHDGFLVGQGHRLACSQRRQGWSEADAAHKGHHYLVHPVQGDHLLHGREGRAGKFAGAGGCAPYMARTEFLHLPLQQFGVVARRQAHDLKLVGKGAHDVQRLPPDGAGGAENHDPSHSRNPVASNI